MNKKLFSWKALAGLALLVAMGLTSCKNSTEVDPNDPYNVKKPATPTSKIDGDYDWEVTITKTTDLDAQWKTVSTKVMKAIADAEADVFNVKINCSSYALDGGTLAIPNAFATVNGKIVNVVFSGAFKSKVDANDVEQTFTVDTKNLKGAEVNIYLPADEFKMKLTASTVKPTLYSESATIISALDATASANKKNALSIEDGVTVSAINMTGALASTDNVVAKLISTDETLVEAKGAQVGSETVYVDDLIVTANATVKGADKAALETVTVAAGTTLTLGSAKSEIKSIVGLGTAKKPTKLVMKGDVDDFSKIGAVTNMVLSGNYVDPIYATVSPTKIADASIFENCVFNMDVDLYSSAANLEFNGDVNLMVDNLATVNFTNVEFGKKAELSVSGTEITSKSSVIKMFQWDKSSATYVAVKDDDEDNLTAANAKGTGVDYAQSNYITWDNTDTWYSQDITQDGITTGMDANGVFFHFAKVEKAVTALTASKKAYDAKVSASGIAAANADAVYTTYKTDWEALYGQQNAELDPIHDADGKAIVANFTAYTDKEIVDGKTAKGTKVKNTLTTNGLLRWYARQMNFVNGANAKISGCDWFTISYSTSDVIVPDAVDVVFDADCTYGGKALSATALNNLISGWYPAFTSAKDAWWTVTLDGETLEWKNTSGGYILK